MVVGARKYIVEGFRVKRW